ncbi:unnamed protein product [Urochloa decumbens]|uniref:Uncharacterized protein n=1 Tax=Urochloa decumbens TaxID=240449 RepID=A0ABC9EWR3_9POAL
MGRPSMEALAMAGADWARYGAGVDDDDNEEEAPPPAHLCAFEAFLEKVVPPDMALAFGREEAARAGERRRRRSRREDVEEKLKLWARAVAREARRGALASNSKSQQAQAATSPRLIAHARDEPVVVLARPPAASPDSLARRVGKEKAEGGGVQTLPGQARVAPSPRSGRRGGEHCQSNQPIAKQDIKCIYGV